MDDLVAVQKREIEILRERLREALAALAPDEFAAPLSWGLTATESRIFAHLRTKPRVTKSSLMIAAYGHWIDEMPPENVLESHISKMRHKVRRYGFEIHSERFAGYRLVAPQSMEAVHHG